MSKNDLWIFKIDFWKSEDDFDAKQIPAIELYCSPYNDITIALSEFREEMTNRDISVFCVASMELIGKGIVKWQQI